jgi:glycosyltransferase involved in cell wall biosynthesis
MINKPLISIITINFNNEKGLLKTIQSIINQTEKSFEYVVIDGGSTDGSVEVIKQYKDLIHFWVSEKDNGIYDAMNKGISKATGQYLMFLNSGDLLSDDSVLSLCLNAVTNNLATDIFYGDMWGTNSDSSKPWLHKHPEKLTLGFLEKSNLNHQSSLVRATLFEEFGLYPPSYKLAGDHWLFLKSFVNSKVFTHINYPLVVYDYSGLSTKSRAIYIREMELMWNIEVPEYVRDIQAELNTLKFKKQSWLTRKAAKVSSKIVYYRKKLFV